MPRCAFCDLKSVRWWDDGSLMLVVCDGLACWNSRLALRLIFHGSTESPRRHFASLEVILDMVRQDGFKQCYQGDRVIDRSCLSRCKAGNLVQWILAGRGTILEAKLNSRG